jgi:hypothetical protein
MNANAIRRNYNEIMKSYRAAGLSVAGDVSFLVWLEKEESYFQKNNEDACNVGLSDYGQTRRDNREAGTIAAIERAMPELAGMVEINGDPRGAAIKLSPYIDDEDHDTRHGCDANPKYESKIRELGFHRDWGGYGMLAPRHQM